MHVNGHFAAVGDAPSREQYEHGVQVINQDKEFKYYAVPEQPSDPAKINAQFQSFNVPDLGESNPFRVQLPSHLRFWLAVNGQIDSPEPPLRHRVRRHVRARAEADDQRNMAVEE